MSRLISISLKPATGATEPVLLQEAKDYLRVDFSDDDDLITAMITAARAKCERLLGMVLIDTDITAVYRQNCGGDELELFYGPVKEDSGAPAIDGLPDGAKVTGQDCDVWVSTSESEVKLTYTSGWDQVPEWAVLAVKSQVAWDYEHRGDEAAASIAPETRSILASFRKTLNDILL